MSEFHINNFITLKLENRKTNIYINGKLFNQCKYILTRKKAYELEEILEIESVDELADKSINEISENFDHSLEGVEPELIDIPPEVRFWVHCSNMQIWVENNYNTKLLHSNLAFPLLTELYTMGDPIAKKVLKEEIAKRLEEGNINTVFYLVKNLYIQILTEEELATLNNPIINFILKLIKSKLTKDDLRIISTKPELNVVKFILKMGDFENEEWPYKFLQLLEENMPMYLEKKMNEVFEDKSNKTIQEKIIDFNLFKYIKSEEKT